MADVDCTPPFPLLPITSQETLRKCSSMPLRTSDVFICSYPKSGTTWMQHIVLSLLLRNSQEGKKQIDPSVDSESSSNKRGATLLPPPYEHVSQYAPFFEVDAHWEQDGNDKDANGCARLKKSIQENHATLGRRVFNTHLRYDMLPKNYESLESVHQKAGDSNTATLSVSSRAKLIYLVRHPLDACISFYHHLSNQVDGYEGTLEHFVEEFTNGTIAFGSWQDHVLSFAPSSKMASSWRTRAACRTRENEIGSNIEEEEKTTPSSSSMALNAMDRDVMFISYEDMVSNLSDVVCRRLVPFLQLQHLSPNILKEQMLPTFTFDYMRSHLRVFQPVSVQWKNNFNFLRGGRIGDGCSTSSNGSSDSTTAAATTTTTLAASHDATSTSSSKVRMTSVERRLFVQRLREKRFVEQVLDVFLSLREGEDVDMEEEEKQERNMLVVTLMGYWKELMSHDGVE